MKKLQLVIVLLAAAVATQGIMSTALLGQDRSSNSTLLVVDSSSETYNIQDKEFVRLADLLSMIEQRFDVSFLFKDEVVEAKFVDLNKIQIGEKIGKELSNIFNEFGLTFSRIDEQTYVLFQKRSPQKTTILQEQISGTVYDAASGESLPGVNVIVKGTTTGTSTDAGGRYELTVESLQDTLVFSFVGYQTQEIAINGRSTIDVQLTPDVRALEDVIVVGYGTVQKSDLTGSVSSVNVDELNQGVTSSVDQMLVGKSAGVNVVRNSGEPGGGFSINIRGAGSINASNSPLYVIDGMPISNSRNVQGPKRSARSSLSSLNTEDIKSIEILKDASATAIYGSRGANGVILITTKGARSGDLQVDYHGYAGVQNFSKKLNLLNPEEYRNVINGIIDDGGESEEFRVGEITHRTDWQDEISNPNALVQSQQLSFSGGTGNSTYYLSLNYMDEEGIVRNTGFNRYSARMNVDSKVSEKLNIGFRLTTSYNKDTFGAEEGRNNGEVYSAQTFNPTLPVQNADGSYALDPFNNRDNPVALVEGINMISNSNRTFGSAFAEYDITDHLYAKVNVGGDFNVESRKQSISEITQAGRRNNGIATHINNQRSNYLVEGTLHYLNTFKVHRVDALAGVSYQRFVGENNFQHAENFPTDALGADNMGLGDQSSYRLDTSKFGHRLGSYIGRINYTLNQKYLLTTTVRIDGSSRFGENNRFAVFPSLALGWKLSEENFLKDLDTFSSLKLRASWGQTGNQGIGNYSSIPTYRQGQNAVWDNTAVTTTSPSRIPNPDLRWETTEQINIGLDYGFLEERITGSFDYYRKKTTDMLLDLPVPQSTGFNTKLSNIGSIVNNGLEFSLSSINVSGNNFTWSSDLTLSTVNNEVKDIGPRSEIIVGGATFFTGNPAIIRPGAPLNSFYGYEIEGIWQEEDDFSVTSDNVHPGSIKFRDQNNDGTVNEEDRVILGDSFPDLSWSFGNTFNYKNLALFVFIEGVQGVEMLNANKVETYYPVNFKRNRLAEPLLNRWTPENPSNKYPSFVDLHSQGAKPVNSYTVEDASYIKLRSIRLSYMFPQVTNFIRNATVYVTGENLYTISDYDGYDPAVNPRGNANYRIDLNAYPTARTFMLGLKLGL